MFRTILKGTCLSPGYCTAIINFTQDPSRTLEIFGYYTCQWSWSKVLKCEDLTFKHVPVIEVYMYFHQRKTLNETDTKLRENGDRSTPTVWDTHPWRFLSSLSHSLWSLGTILQERLFSSNDHKSLSSNGLLKPVRIRLHTKRRVKVIVYL